MAVSFDWVGFFFFPVFFCFFIQFFCFSFPNKYFFPFKSPILHGTYWRDQLYRQGISIIKVLSFTFLLLFILLLRPACDSQYECNQLLRIINCIEDCVNRSFGLKCKYWCFYLCLFLQTGWCLFMRDLDCSVIFKVPSFVADWFSKWIALGLSILYAFSVIKGRESKWNTTCKSVHFVFFAFSSVPQCLKKFLFIIQFIPFCSGYLKRRSQITLIQHVYAYLVHRLFLSYWDFKILFLHLVFLLKTQRSVPLILFNSWYFRCLILFLQDLFHLVQLLFVPNRVLFLLIQPF